MHWVDLKLSSPSGSLKTDEYAREKKLHKINKDPQGILSSSKYSQYQKPANSQRSLERYLECVGAGPNTAAKRLRTSEPSND